MNTAEIVVGEMQGNRGLQVRQLLAERIRESRKTAHRHSHGQVLPLYVASRNFIGVRVATSDFGYNLRDPWRGVPRIGALSEVPEQFHKLSKVYVRPKALGNADRVVIQPVRCEL